LGSVELEGCQLYISGDVPPVAVGELPRVAGLPRQIFWLFPADEVSGAGSLIVAEADFEQPEASVIFTV
jgi:hypothetical protein